MFLAEIVTLHLFRRLLSSLWGHAHLCVFILQLFLLRVWLKEFTYLHRHYNLLEKQYECDYRFVPKHEPANLLVSQSNSSLILHLTFSKNWSFQKFKLDLFECLLCRLFLEQIVSLYLWSFSSVDLQATIEAVAFYRVRKLFCVGVFFFFAHL